eukprot:tig00020911_g15715.t1
MMVPVQRRTSRPLVSHRQRSPVRSTQQKHLGPVRPSGFCVAHPGIQTEQTSEYAMENGKEEDSVAGSVRKRRKALENGSPIKAEAGDEEDGAQSRVRKTPTKQKVEAASPGVLLQRLMLGQQSLFSSPTKPHINGHASLVPPSPGKPPLPPSPGARRRQLTPDETLIQARREASDYAGDLARLAGVLHAIAGSLKDVLSTQEKIYALDREAPAPSALPPPSAPAPLQLGAIRAGPGPAPGSPVPPGASVPGAGPLAGPGPAPSASAVAFHVHSAPPGHGHPLEGIAGAQAAQQRAELLPEVRQRLASLTRELAEKRALLSSLKDAYQAGALRVGGVPAGMAPLPQPPPSPQKQ